MGARRDRPFSPALWGRAREIAEQYAVVIQPEPEVGFLGRTLEMPFVMADGRTQAECMEQVREASTLAVATMLELGDTPPGPAREERRDQQVNVRVSAEERARLDAASRREGFRSLSDFVRAAAIARAG